MPEQCLQCDDSCASTCHSLGPKGCHVCKNGYNWDDDHGCMDIDECNNTVELNPCKFNSYCINTQGSYKCYRKCLFRYLGFCLKNQIKTKSFFRIIESKNF